MSAAGCRWLVFQAIYLDYSLSALHPSIFPVNYIYLIDCFSIYVIEFATVFFVSASVIVFDVLVMCNSCVYDVYLYITTDSASRVLAACSDPAQQRLLHNCTAQNGTWYDNTCYTQAHTDPQVYRTIANLTAFNGSVTPRLPSDEYFQ